MAVQPIPEGQQSVTPYLVVKDAAALIDFLRRAFDAREMVRHARPDGTIMHAQIKIGDSVMMMGEPMGDQGTMPAMLHLYVANVDQVYEQALAAGATSIMPPTDQFYGDRSGAVADKHGNHWWIGTHIEDVSKEEMVKRMAAAG
ncbi:MAG: VOC family protein [Geminicoccaceae bacterium]